MGSIAAGRNRVGIVLVVDFLLVQVMVLVMLQVLLSPLMTTLVVVRVFKLC